MQELEERETANFFDFKGFLFKVLRFWPLFLICLGIAFGIAYRINIKKLPIYRLQNKISIRDDQNPLFTNNTSLIFNWGGTTNKVQTNIVLFKSRSHNEKVVSYLQYYVNYQKQGKYQLEDVYGETPFKLWFNDSLHQLSGKRIIVDDNGDGTFTFSVNFPNKRARLYNYKTHQLKTINLDQNSFKETYTIGDSINLPFLNGILRSGNTRPKSGEQFFINLGSFNGTVGRYKNITIDQNPRGSSILDLSLSGTNKNRIVEYLNTSVKVRVQDQLDRKNLFATNTIKYIDSTLSVRNIEQEKALEERNDFNSKNINITLKGGSETVTSKLQQLDLQKDQAEQRLSYYIVLEDYMINRTDYSNVPAPSVAGINESSITSIVSRISQLAVDRSLLVNLVEEGNQVLEELDAQINAEKKVLLENIVSSKAIINREIQDINRDIGTSESELRRFPKGEQELSTIERRLALGQAAINLFQAKRSEAVIVKASNVSDILFIDAAKDVGGGKVGPVTKFSYVVAGVIGGAVPLALVFLLVFFDTKIGDPEEIKNLSHIPILGVVGKSSLSSNLVLKDYPRSSVAESFRGLRSSLQFIYRKQDVEGAKTVLVTSSVSGEGKTFTSINLASVFALSEKKTVLVGLDLRKPKIFDDFELENSIGVVNYLIGDKTLKEIVQASNIPYLDIILAGPIPPNPSELLLSEVMSTFMQELKQTYDYIILDTPPVGLVADALEITKYADASLYMIRQGYSKKGMLGFINDKYAKGEVENISYVLNYFKNRGNYGYGYGYGYGGYGNGYHDNGKQQNLLQRTTKRLKKVFKK